MRVYIVIEGIYSYRGYIVIEVIYSYRGIYSYKRVFRTRI